MGWNGYSKASGDSSGYVYFLRLGNRIKIGYSTDPIVRQRTLGGRSIGLIPGTLQDEASLHLQFDHLRDVGEWFEDDQALIDHIESLVRERTLSLHFGGDGVAVSHEAQGSWVETVRGRFFCRFDQDDDHYWIKTIHEDEGPLSVPA